MSNLIATAEPVEASDESKIETSTFADFKFPVEIQRAIASQGYEVATPIQAMSIPAILAGQDVVGQAETGTGKTAAFALPLLTRVDLQLRQPQVLVLTPTRELAMQVANAFEKYGRHLKKLEVATVYGGQHFSIQLRQLARGPQIVVGTPGRIMDHLRREQLSLAGLRTLVLDEADEMLRMGFADDVEWIMEQAPAERQTLLFSATMPHNVQSVAEKYLSTPEHIRVKSKSKTAATVHQRVCCVKYSEKQPTLALLLESEATDGVIVFVKTRQTSSRVAEELCQRGYRASALNGDMQQNQREQTVGRLKSGQLDILVATDVAARGLDVQRISHVINFDYPHDSEAYVHRIGRTGRAGRTGHAILLLSPREKRKLRALEAYTGQAIEWMERPTMDSVRQVRMEKLATRIAELSTRKLAKERAWVAELLAGNSELTLEDIAASLANMTAYSSPENYSPPSDTEQAPRKRDRKRERSFEDRVMGFSRRESSTHPGERDQESRQRRSGGKRPGKQAWTKYRIEVGYKHGVRPNNIVGAITSESGMVGSDIGSIDIENDFTKLDLPQHLTEAQIDSLQHLKVAGQPLRLTRLAERSFRAKSGRNGKPKWKKNKTTVGKSKNGKKKRKAPRNPK